MASDPPKSDSEPFEQTQDAPARSDSAGSKRSAHAKLPQTEHKAKTPIDTGGVGSGSGSGFGTELHFIDGDPKSIPSDKNGLLFGKYKKLKDDPLGGGGMAFIWLVEHVELGQRRALKTITSEIAENPSNRQRFKQEAQILATLSRHPNAVTVYDTKMVGKHAYIEMDYLEGKTLREFFEPETPVALSVVLEILGQICDVLSEAHAAGIIHRDIKPHNIMVVPDLSSPIGQRVKVLDFGIAKRLNEPDPDGGVLTRPNQVLGTVSYASPEQLGLTLDGKKAIAVDSRSDIYSLGILLYELLAGTRPFEGPYTKVWYDHVNTPAPAIAERAPSAHVPAAVEAVVLSCLEKNPAKRPQSARELFQKFQSAVRRAAFEELSDEKTPVGEGPEDIPADPNGNLFGKYRVIRLLGGGGMASVWLVEHIRLKRKCALKVIRSAVARNPANRLRFQREAEILAKLSKHPNAVPVYDTDMEGGYAYIEMDYLEGKTLKDYFPPSTPAPLDKAIWILGDLCSVLSAAHDLGIVHRDIKPQNIMIVPDATAPAGERVKMLDFGIAKITEQNPSDLASLTQMNTSAYVGTYAYSSPEQLGQTWDGQKEPLIDHRSDVYSLGILLYEMLGGIRPFSGPQTKLHFDHVYTPAPAFAERAPDAAVPTGVEAVVLTCLAKHPNDRPQSVQELFERFSAAARAAMEDAAEEETETLDRLVPVERDAGTATTGASRRLPRWIRDRRVGLGAAAAVVGIGVLVLGIAMARRGGESSKSAGGGTIEVSHNGETTVPPVGPVVTPKPKPQWDPEVLSSLVNLGLEPAEEASISKKWPETVQRRDQKLQKLKRMGNYYIPADYAEDSPAGKGEQTGLPKVLVRQRLPNKESVRFILLEGSQSFRMGEYDKNADFDPQAITAHVRPLSSFYIQEHEVTNFELTQFSKMSHSADLDKDLVDFTTFASRFQTENKSSSVDDFPAAFVTHRLATAFAERMGGRLPSEGQWEFAARSRCALRDRMYVWGNDDANVERKANICGNNYQNAVMQWKEDKTLQGVYDLTGNVREWCRDVWEPFPPDRDKFNYVAVAGEGVTDPEFVIRGGSFETIAKTAKVVWRESYNGVRYKEIATKPVPDVGFRVVLEPIRIPDPTLAEDELAAQPEREAKP